MYRARGHAASCPVQTRGWENWGPPVGGLYPGPQLVFFTYSIYLSVCLRERAKARPYPPA